MEPHNSEPVSPEVMAELSKFCLPDTNILTLEAFIQTVLYNERIGYYLQDRQRVGRNEKTDFYTASNVGTVFPRLIVDCARHLLEGPLEDYVFVEAGPETKSGILGSLETIPFRATHLIRPGDPFDIPPKSIVFSNELFDAQPFRRFVFTNGKWCEMGVKLEETGLEWVVIDLLESLPELPVSAPEGYVIDWPNKAHEVLQDIAGQDWKGLFIAFDYGLDSPTIFKERPQGTGRTYSNHKMGNDLLERPGQIDITCHVVWDFMEQILRNNRFMDIRLSRQESFFMQFAQSEIQSILENNPTGFSREKQSLMELIHPGNMGHQFQVLSALRMES